MYITIRNVKVMIIIKSINRRAGQQMRDKLQASTGDRRRREKIKINTQRT
jgi:hypothetical protein